MRVLLLLVVMLCIPQQLLGDISFTFNYNDGAGTGFNDTTQGATRQAALELAANNFGSAFSSYTGNIVMDVTGTATGSTLAAAGDAGGPTFSPGFGLNEVIRNKVLNGTDVNGSTADGSVTVNFASVGWELDINATPSGGDFDWYSTMYHEFAHAFGFSSAVQTDSSGLNAVDAFGTTGAADGEFGAFDQFLTNSAGTSLFTSGSDLDETNYETLLIAGASPATGLFFNGTNAVAANGGNPVGLYTPSPFEEGSSGSHLDDQNPALAGSMMLAATGSGPSARSFSNIELGIFRDIGYANVSQITAIPEPTSLSMLFLGAVGGLISNRRLGVRNRKSA